MTIVAILAAVAIPAYLAYVARGHRSEARSTLVAGAQWMERWRTEKGTYLDGGNAPPLPYTVSPPTGTPKYNIGFQAAPTAGGYVLMATPTGSMTGDECGNLTLSSTGLRTKTGVAGIELCWGR